MAEKIKFKVSIKELSFEYEGSREVGQALQAGLSRSLASLVDTQKTVMLPASSIPIMVPENENGTVDSTSLSATPSIEKTKRPRKTNGVSVVNLLRELKEERFFSEPRSAENIREKLRVKGHSINASTLAGRLQELTKKNEFYRHQDDEHYVYKDTPFNEGAGTTKPADKPSE